MIIKIIITDDEGEVLGKREATSWESANENFGKLERLFNIAAEEEL